MTITGHCLCSTVSYHTEGPLDNVLHCHCENCRRASGNFVAAARCETEQVFISGEENVGWHDMGYAKYGFCRQCGSHMFWVAADRPDIVALQVGCINNAGELRLGAVWFADEAQPHNTLPTHVPHFSGNDEANS